MTENAKRTEMVWEACGWPERMARDGLGGFQMAGSFWRLKLEWACWFKQMVGEASEWLQML